MDVSLACAQVLRPDATCPASTLFAEEIGSRRHACCNEGRRTDSSLANRDMPYGLYISAEGALAQSTRIDVLANNLANVDTPGFKRDLAVFQARYAQEVINGGDYPGSGSVNQVGGGVLVMGTETDYSPGPVKNTGQPTDIAIQGPGFFVVDQAGQQLLTRAGNFALTAEGQLVTTAGDAVLNVEGEPIFVPQELGPWLLTADGAIQQAGNVNPLAMVVPESLGDLVKVGENMFSSLSTPAPVDPAERRVVQGFLEISDVDPTTEMVELITASRAFEANVNMIRNQDQIIGALVTRVLRVA